MESPCAAGRVLVLVAGKSLRTPPTHAGGLVQLNLQEGGTPPRTHKLAVGCIVINFISCIAPSFLHPSVSPDSHLFR